MKQWYTRFVGLASTLVVGVIVLGAAAPDSGLVFHERKEVAGLAIVLVRSPSRRSRRRYSSFAGV